MNLYVIRHEDYPDRLWSNALGWVEDNSYDVFTEQDRSLQLPIDGEWSFLAEVDPRGAQGCGSIILISGNPVDGLKFWGPFSNEVEAIDFADINVARPWWTGELISTMDAEAIADEPAGVVAA